MPSIDSACVTIFGKFRIKIDDSNIHVGGKTFCVNIALNRDNTATLYWLKTDNDKEGCELNDKDIQDNTKIQMTDLAFSLLRKYYPDYDKYVTLLDDSGFSWKDSRGKKYKTNFLKGYLLLHRKTWYEDKFNAVMCNADIYSEYRKKADNNFDDPSKKPNIFNFMNPFIKEKLEPLYRGTRTWGEFINKFVEKYGNEKYYLMYDWYRYAIYTIFDGMEINQDWKIDISKRPYIECDTMMMSPPSRMGGSAEFSKTIKQRRQRHGQRRNPMTFSKYHRLEPFSWSP
jgi:hypothetical protein